MGLKQLRKFDLLLEVWRKNRVLQVISSLLESLKNVKKPIGAKVGVADSKDSAAPARNRMTSPMGNLAAKKTASKPTPTAKADKTPSAQGETFDMTKAFEELQDIKNKLDSVSKNTTKATGAGMRTRSKEHIPSHRLKEDGAPVVGRVTLTKQS